MSNPACICPDITRSVSRVEDGRAPLLTLLTLIQKPPPRHINSRRLTLFVIIDGNIIGTSEYTLGLRLYSLVYMVECRNGDLEVLNVLVEGVWES